MLYLSIARSIALLGVVASATGGPQVAHPVGATASTIPASTPGPAPIDGTSPLIDDMAVTALACAPGGRDCYAAGIAVGPVPAGPLVQDVIYSAGAVFAVSHDAGRTWVERATARRPHAIPPSESRAMPWRDHTMLPTDFAATSLTLDPTDPRTIYATGCTDGGADCRLTIPGHLLLRSTDAGRTWADALVYDAPVGTDPASPLVRTTIGRTPAFVERAREGGAPTIATSVAIAPAAPAHIAACVAGIGVLTSADAGRAWRYPDQPVVPGSGCDVVAGSPDGRILYRTDRTSGREGGVQRSPDGGAHWATRSMLGVVPPGASSNILVTGVSGPVVTGRTFAATTRDGIYASTDGGARWARLHGLPIGGALTVIVGSVRVGGGWVAAVAAAPPGREGLYGARDGGAWRLVGATDGLGRAQGGALDLPEMGGGRFPRLWANAPAHIVYTAGPYGGLYRWEVNL